MIRRIFIFSLFLFSLCEKIYGTPYINDTEWEGGLRGTVRRKQYDKEITRMCYYLGLC